VFYVETSAATKLVLEERGSAALRRWLAPRVSAVFSSDLLRTELLRVARRSSPVDVLQARVVLDSMLLSGLSSELFERAALFEPRQLRSLDALHLAAALEAGPDLDGIVTYDARLAEAAAGMGVPVVSPR
jgi:predicted nucleic acid-binding protein